MLFSIHLLWHLPTVHRNGSAGSARCQTSMMPTSKQHHGHAHCGLPAPAFLHDLLWHLPTVPRNAVSRP
eukprot:12937279-Prorocentrum_lima.AAC.1